MPLPLPPRGGWAGRAGAEGALSLALSSADQTSPLRVSSLNLRSLEPPEIGGVSASPSLLLAFPRPPHGASRVHIGEPGLRLKRELLRGHDLQGGGGGACRGSACLPGLEQAPRASHFQTHLGASLRPPPRTPTASLPWWTVFTSWSVRWPQPGDGFANVVQVAVGGWPLVWEAGRGLPSVREPRRGLTAGPAAWNCKIC